MCPRKIHVLYKNFLLIKVGKYEEAMALYSKIRRINKGDNTQTDSKVRILINSPNGIPYSTDT